MIEEVVLHGIGFGLLNAECSYMLEIEGQVTDGERRCT